MSKEKLIRQLKQKNPKLNLSDVETIIDVFSKKVMKTLMDGDSLEIRGFGRWNCKLLKENYNARNPATNDLIYKPRRFKVKFKASKKLNRKINE